jgi:hypothetical protein
MSDRDNFCIITFNTKITHKTKDNKKQKTQKKTNRDHQKKCSQRRNKTITNRKQLSHTIQMIITFCSSAQFWSNDASFCQWRRDHCVHDKQQKQQQKNCQHSRNKNASSEARDDASNKLTRQRLSAASGTNARPIDDR